MDQESIRQFEKTGTFSITVAHESIDLILSDVEINSEDIPGWLVANEGSLTVALDLHISEELRQEGIAREFINRVQNFRKSSGLDVTDRIELGYHCADSLKDAIIQFENYICEEVLANQILFVADYQPENGTTVDLEEQNLWLTLF
jgi:isoleucyl-tRNA synthetase